MFRGFCGELKMSEKVKLSWRQDPDAETILREVACVDYVVQVIGLEEVDWSESANNCARLSNPLNAEKIEDYTTCMKRGDIFPRIVVERHKKKDRYIILGGNQRSAALKSIDPSADVECYVVDPLSSDERELIIRSLNSRHGWGSTKEERIEHAVFLVRKYGMHIPTVAKAMIVSETAILARIRAEDERARLAKAKIDASRMSLVSLTSLARIHDEDIRNRVAQMAIEKNIPGCRLEELASAVDAAKTRAKVASVVADFSKATDALNEIKQKSPSKLKKPRRERFLSLITSLSDFLERGNDGSAFSTLDELSCSVDHDLDNVRMLSAKINARLQCICEAGK